MVLAAAMTIMLLGFGSSFRDTQGGENAGVSEVDEAVLQQVEDTLTSAHVHTRTHAHTHTATNSNHEKPNT